MRRFMQAASAENAPLLPDLHDVADAWLPDPLYCVGPYWLEDWRDVEAQEQFRTEPWSTAVNREIPALLADLARIRNLECVPKLRTPAAELYRVLARGKDEAIRQVSTVKALSAGTSAWLAMPVDYPHFWKRDAETGAYPALDDHDLWHGALASCAGESVEVLPVVPRYRDQEAPYVAVIGASDPAGLSRVFDDRYVAASSELNLLNTILLQGGAAG